MAVAAKGRSILKLLALKDSEPWRNLNIDQVIYQVHGTLKVRLPQIEGEFERIGDRASRKLFERSLKTEPQR